MFLFFPLSPHETYFIEIFFLSQDPPVPLLQHIPYYCIIISTIHKELLAYQNLRI